MASNDGGSLADLWGAGARAFWSAQQKMMEDGAKAIEAMHHARPPALGAPPLDGDAWAAASKSFGELWTAAIEASQAMAKSFATRGADPTVSATLGKIFEPQLWLAGTDEMGQTLQRLAEGPRLADLWKDERRLLAISRAWVEMRRAGLDHNAVMLDAWRRAAAAFATRLDEKAKAGEQPQAWRDVVALWTETANLVLLQTQRSAPYLEAQQKLLRASTELRLAQREAAEHYGEMFGLPTRSEIDELTRTVTQLRRELRALQRERAATAPAPKNPEPSDAEGHLAPGGDRRGARRGGGARPKGGARRKAVQRDT